MKLNDMLCNTFKENDVNDVTLNIPYYLRSLVFRNDKILIKFILFKIILHRCSA